MEIKGQIEDLLNKFNSRLEHVEKKLDTLDSDRAIFENIQGRLTALEEQWKMTRQNDNDVKKDIKEEIQLSSDRTIAKVETHLEEVQDIIKGGKTGKKVEKNLLEKIKDKLKWR